MRIVQLVIPIVFLVEHAAVAEPFTLSNFLFVVPAPVFYMVNHFQAALVVDTEVVLVYLMFFCDSPSFRGVGTGLEDAFELYFLVANDLDIEGVQVVAAVQVLDFLFLRYKGAGFERLDRQVCCC